MRRCALFCAMLSLSFGANSLSAADLPLKIRIEKLVPPEELKDSIKALLSDEAILIENDKGVVSTIWFRKEIPSKATPEQVKNGITYREIAATTLIGAIQFPQKWSDYRKQEIPKGVYTLRFAIQPMDGDHMGTAPHNEFCLLCPADKDMNPDATTVKAANEMSAAAHGGNHPTVLLLYPNSKPEAAPKVISKGNGIHVLNSKRDMVAGNQKLTLGFGMTIVGHTAE